MILGTFTAQMGDPTGRDKARPILSEDEVKANAEKILEQVSRVLQPGFHVHRNHEWFETMNVPFLLARLASNFTVSNMMSRDGFKKRGQSGVSVHELLVPMLQGWDSVVLNADVEIGGTDQLFNFQTARELQAKEGQRPQVCLMTPVINGTDGRKMSKSFGNCIFLDEVPEEIFGKVMSISDEVMDEWIPLLTDGIDEPHPMKRKKLLAFDIVSQIHGVDAAKTGQSHFESKIQRGNPEDVIEVSETQIINVIQKIRKCSKTVARNLLKSGAVSVDGEKIFDQTLSFESGTVIKVGKRSWGRIK